LDQRTEIAYVDLCVEVGGIKSAVPKQIGNLLEIDTVGVKPGSKSMPKPVNPLPVRRKSTPLESEENMVPRRARR